MVNDALAPIQTPAPVETPPVSDPNPAPVAEPLAEGEFEVADDGTITYADGYRIDADGRHFDADGTELTEDPADPAEPVAPIAAAPVTPAPADPSAPVQTVQPATPSVPTAPSGPAYNYNNCFKPEEMEQLAALDMSDPLKAQQFRYERWKRVDAYASDVFDAQVEALETQAPELTQRFARQIDRAKRTLTVEQLQSPGIVNEIAARIVAQSLAADPKKLEDLVLGRAPVQAVAAVPAPASPVEKPAAPVIPPEQRMPKPRGVRRQVPNRNGAGQFAGSQSGLKTIQQLYPGMSDDEAKEYMQGIQNAERRRDN